MKISVIGTGYVGLVSGVCLAEKGHSVLCVDVDEEIVTKINNGIAPIHEQGLPELLKKNIGKSLRATSNLPKAVHESDLSIIAVGTPFDGDQIDLQYVKTVVAQIGEAMKSKEGYHTVVVKSTVVPGTTDNIVLPLLEETSGKKAGVDFGVGMNPEFLREGQAINDFMNPDRIVLGGINKRTHKVLETLYRVFEGIDVIKTNNQTAEMIKYTANSLLATLISFSNEIGNLCAKLDNVDVVKVMEGVHKDSRFSPILPDGERITPGFISYLAAGCGFGGSCFPKDVKALISHGKAVGSSMSLLDSVIQTNENQPYQVISLLQKHFENIEEVPISVLGLAFKPGTDDMRESPAIPVIEYLLKNGAKVQAYDPVAQNEAKKLFGNHQIEYFDDLSRSISGTEAVILLTSWEEFKQVPAILDKLEDEPLFIDGRRMLEKQRFEKYEGIGLS